MPSRAPAANNDSTTACKIVSVLGQDSTGDIPASKVLMDETTGHIKNIINAQKLTAFRNACGSTLFLSRFPAEEFAHFILFGTGA
ncbi:hypothetical protein L204_102477 [Cryptococcus depauperatus]|nr:hypothetical protein L204_00774 [Cryptococcus depauperatus CBS 7855]